MTLAGINGERVDAITRVLTASSVRMTATEIVDSLRVNGYERLVRTVGPTETVQEALRRMEAMGLVDRARGGPHAWGLAAAPSEQQQS